MTWSCKACTFLNDADGSLRCEMCGTPREEQSSAKGSTTAKDATTTGNKSNKRQRRMTMSSCIRIDGWLLWDPTVESLEDFLEHARPSQVSSLECHWISVSNPNRTTTTTSRNTKDQDSTAATKMKSTTTALPSSLSLYHDALNKFEAIIASRGRVRAWEKQQCVDSLLQTAIQSGETVGKWMLWSSHDRADALWRTVATETVEGRLGCSAKIAPAKINASSHSILCCVYVQDFSDKQNVKRVLLRLRELGFQVKAGFKPDIYTHLGIETGNRWRLPPTIYSVKEVLEWEFESHS